MASAFQARFSLVFGRAVVAQLDIPHQAFSWMIKMIGQKKFGKESLAPAYRVLAMICI